MKNRVIVAATVAAILLVFAFFHFNGKSGGPPSGGGPQVLNWERLDMLDYRSGQMPGWLEDLNNQTVRVPGFVVPLEDNYESVSEFLLVPDPGSCVHVPPPPPNQMVYVKMKSGQRVQLRGIPIWVTGKLKIENVKSPYGIVAYSLEGDITQRFEGWHQFEQ
ncbi:MAG: DUF3299 domain-containing protein [Bdellovibrionales bacterium]|nr:DUF3299 domain-containing protein [Bdellovibrionales bacterium]